MGHFEFSLQHEELRMLDHGDGDGGTPANILVCATRESISPTAGVVVEESFSHRYRRLTLEINNQRPRGEPKRTAGKSKRPQKVHHMQYGYTDIRFDTPEKTLEIDRHVKVHGMFR
jgi:hypothetical protein